MAIILNDAMEYNKYKCRPRERDYTKLYLTYKAIPSSTYGKFYVIAYLFNFMFKQRLIKHLISNLSGG